MVAASPLKKYAAELLGTFGLVFIGTGAIVLNDVTAGAVSHLGISIAFGAAVTAMIYAFGSTSGAHINPAVSVAFWLSGHLERKQLLPYIASQLVGAVLASVLLWLLVPAHATLGATLPGIGVWQTFLLELLLSWALMQVIISLVTTTHKINRLAAVLIGSTVLLEAFVAGPFTGASMNPARSLGPALLSGQLQDLWLYLLAPIIGASIAIATCRATKGRACCTQGCHA